MHFKDEPLQNVVEVLNRNIDSLEFEIVSGIEQRAITATFSKDSPDSVAELIALALNLRYLKDGNKIIIYELP
jgi:ferric-dicitrate binding protein FerR (iron transport regulator)